MVNIIPDQEEFSFLLDKYQTSTKDINKWVVSICKNHNNMTPEQLERRGFESGKKRLFNDKIKEFLTFIDLDYVDRASEILKDYGISTEEITEAITGVKFENKADVTLEQVHKKYAELLYIEDKKRIDVVLATCLSAKMEGIPLWLLLVGASGDMKSAQLNAVRTSNVEVMHNLTSKTLVNGYQDKIKHPDLAPALDGKVVIIPDMSQILKLAPNEKAEVWGQLRDLYDGYAGKASGQGTNTKYKDLKITLLAGSTPAIDGQILIHQDLGTRELIYRTSGSKNKELVMQKCLENEEFEEKINRELREITSNFLDQREITRPEISKNVLDSLKNMAQYTAYMRTPAEFDNYTNELRNEVYPEEPTRIIKQFKRLFICLKSLDENYSDARALEIIRHIARSSAFPIRIKIYELLVKQEKEFSTSQIAESFNIGKSTAKRECSVLEALGLVKCRREPINSQYSDKTYDYWAYNPSKLIILTILTNNMNTIDSIISMDETGREWATNPPKTDEERLAYAEQQAKLREAKE